MPEERVSVVAVAQAAAVVDDVDRNLATLSRLVRTARDRGAEVVVTPELFATGYAPDRAWRHDGASVRSAIAEIARTHGVAVVGSTVDSTGDGATHRIAASLFDRSGDELLRVHKRHLFGPVEQQWMTPGDSIGEPIDWRASRWGMGICYDVEFPEFVRAQALAGAEVMLVPTAVPIVEAGVNDLGDAWHYSATQTSTLQLPARALDNGVVIAYANHCGDGFTGRSCIATPFGRNAVLLGEEEAVGVVRVSLMAIQRAREINTYLADSTSEARTRF
jgi:5-aminopentanamidase